MVSMGWWLLRLSTKILALLRLSVNFFQLRLMKKLKINFFCFKEFTIHKPVFFVSFKQKRGRDCVERRRSGTRHGNVYRSVGEKQGIVVYRQRVLQTVTLNCVLFH